MALCRPVWLLVWWLVSTFDFIWSDVDVCVLLRCRRRFDFNLCVMCCACPCFRWWVGAQRSPRCRTSSARHRSERVGLLSAHSSLTRSSLARVRSERWLVVVRASCRQRAWLQLAVLLAFVFLG